MRTRIVEIVLGLVVLVVAAIFLVFAWKTTLGRGGAHRYQIAAVFNATGSIGSGSPVKIGGYTVGAVDAMALDPKTYRISVKMRLDGTVKIPTDSLAKISTSGLLGKSFVEIVPGHAEAFVRPGGVLHDTRDAYGLENLVGSLISNLPS